MVIYWQLLISLFGQLSLLVRWSFYLLLFSYRPLMISTFDSTFSRMSGLNTTLIHYFVMLLLSIVTVASIQTVGIILVVALLITPASTAFLISKQLYTMMIIAGIISVISSIVGLYFSYIYNIPSGATIVICTFIIYVMTLAITRIKNKQKRSALT